MKALIERISNLRNAQRLGRKEVVFLLPFGQTSNIYRRNLFRILVREGYLESFVCVNPIGYSNERNGAVYTLVLKYNSRGEPAIRELHPISLGGRRVYLPASALWQPQFLNGTLILSTPHGLLTDTEARRRGVGGEVLRGIRLLIMFSLPVPSAITVSFVPGHLSRSGPRGTIRTVTGPYCLRLLETSSERRLFLTVDSTLQPEARPSVAAQAARLSRLAAQREGLVRGYRRRLRLVGVGFRAIRVDSPSSPQNPRIAFKLGYSHDVERGLGDFFAQGVSATPSRLEGRTKGTLISLEGIDLSRLNQSAASIRALRYPDPYKGKGIQYDREVIVLKKGKREGLPCYLIHPANLMASPFSPRYAIAHLAKSKIWPTKNSRLRGFFSIRGRRLQRGGAFRRFVRVLTTRKWTEARRQIRPLRRRSGTGRAGGGRTALGRPHLRRYRDAFYHKQQLRAFHGKRTESRLRSLLRRYPSGTRLTTGASTRSFFAALEGRLDRVLFRRRLRPTIYASHQFLLHQGVSINGRLERSPHALLQAGDRLSIVPAQALATKTPRDLLAHRVARWQSTFDSLFTRLYYRRWGLYVLRRRLSTQLKKKLRPFARSTRSKLAPLFLPPAVTTRQPHLPTELPVISPRIRHYLKFWLSLRLRSNFLPRLVRSFSNEQTIRYPRTSRRRSRRRYLVTRRSKRERRRKLPRLKPAHRYFPSYLQRERRTLRGRRLRSPASEERRYTFRGPAAHLFTFYRSRGRLINYCFLRLLVIFIRFLHPYCMGFSTSQALLVSVPMLKAIS